MELINNVGQYVETLNLTLIYGALIGLGIAFCGFAYFFGGDDGGLGDVGDGGDSGLIISPTGLAFFCTAFGAFGLILYHGFSMSALGSMLLSVVLSTIMMFVFNYLFFKVFLRSGSTVQAERLEGVRGEVYTSIPEGGTGEIIYRDSRGRQKSPAREAQGKALAAGTQVVIQSAMGVTLVVTQDTAPSEGNKD